MAKRKGTGVVIAGLAGLAASYLSKKENRDKALSMFNNMKSRLESYLTTGPDMHDNIAERDQQRWQQRLVLLQRRLHQMKWSLKVEDILVSTSIMRKFKIRKNNDKTFSSMHEKVFCVGVVLLQQILIIQFP